MSLSVSIRIRRAALPGAIGALLLCALAIPADASADRRVVRDALRETKPLKRNGRLDIRKAVADHRGELLEHTIVMRKRVQERRGRERPLLTINVRGGRRSDPEFMLFGDSAFRVRPNGDPKRIGEADLRPRGRRWTYLLDPDVIPAFEQGTRYGWAAVTSKGNAFDVAPARRYKQHRV